MSSIALCPNLWCLSFGWFEYDIAHRFTSDVVKSRKESASEESIITEPVKTYAKSFIVIKINAVITEQIDAVLFKSFLSILIGLMILLCHFDFVLAKSFTIFYCIVCFL